MSSTAPTLYQIIESYSSRYFGELVIDIGQHQKCLSCDEHKELEFIRQGADNSLTCIHCGIQALGQQLATAATNKDAGMNNDSIADIRLCVRISG